MYSVILCGGSGSRLWPLSRKNFPKQFLNLYSDHSLLQETYMRVRETMPKEHIFFITNKENLFNVFNQIREIEKDFSQENVLIEPESRNTAPAITYAVKYLQEKKGVLPDDPIFFLPADHFIGKGEKFVAILNDAAKIVNGYIGTIGVIASQPETGYGYIRKSEKLEGNMSRVVEFKEKPDKTSAEEYVKSGQYVWNSGMYIFSASTFENELRKHAPDFYKLFSEKFELLEQHFSLLPELSIDYVLSEKSDNVVVFEGDFGWSDIGSFDSVAEISEHLKKSIGTRHIGVDSKNIFVHSTNNRLVTTLGVEDLIIIENNDSILIQKRGRSEDVKKIVGILKEQGAKEVEHQLVVHRPWGKYEILIENPTYKVKKITVYPGAKLSLQSHFHRVEHWVVVKGTAKIVNGDEEIYLNEDESTFIPKMNRHRMENPGKENLEIIEVQTGTYLEEDDIIRYEDQYNRS